MNALQELHKRIDESDWDIAQEDEINKAFQEVNGKLEAEKDAFTLRHSEVERQAFAFSKSPEKRLSFKLSGTRKLEDGTEIPFEWPDLSTFSEEDFKHLFDRYYSSKNLFAKTEYGLVLYYAGKLVRNEDVLLLLDNLFELAKSYLQKGKTGGDRNYYISYTRIVLANGLHIAENRKDNEKIKQVFTDLILFVFNVHQQWNVKHEYGLRVIIDYTGFAIDYFKDFESLVDLKLFIQKNWEAAEHLSNTYTHGAIYVADISIRLSKKLGLDIKDWHSFKARQYEKLSEEAKGRSNLAAVSFLEKSMELYKGLKDEANLGRLQAEYQKLRNHFKLNTIKSELPQEENQRIAALIKQEVAEGTPEQIVKTLLFTPMIRPLAELRQRADEAFQEHIMLSMFPTSIQDKFGNTVAQYSTEEERKKFALLQTYGFHLQVATQTLIEYFIEAFKLDKISSNTVISLLNQTWLGKGGMRTVNGNDVAFSYIKLLEPGINSIFIELNQWKETPGYLPNFVSATDSLVLKAEYLLREFCYRLGIPSFKPKARDPNIIMEKTLDDLLLDLDGKLKEDDHFFIKFILTEKAGYNLRNRIAHGLMDNVDYGMEYPLLALIIILKLSNYQFEPKTNQ